MKKIFEILILIGLGMLLVSFVDLDNYSISYDHYAVKPGQTVWEIAEIYMPKQNKIRDIRELVYEIREKNNLHGHIQPGQVLEIPLWTKK